RVPRPNTIGLALGGGAARGIAHIGVLQVLEENAIFPDYVAGTSIGALIGGLYAAGISATRMQLLTSSTRWRNLLTLNIPSLSLANISLAGGNIPFLENATAFFDLGRLIEWVDNVLGGDVDFTQLNVPFAALATDLVSGETVALNKGPIAPAIRASCSVPGIFTPVRREGRLLVDGGISHNLPVSVVREMGADYVISVDLLPTGGATIFSRQLEQAYEPKHIVDIGMAALYSLIRVTQRDLVPANATITPAIGHISFTDLGQRDQLIARGRAAAEEMMPQILMDLGRSA
ncbi:MAG: patatin-like phospholipase family protein, partial [Caldilineaceae bacterium]